MPEVGQGTRGRHKTFEFRITGLLVRQAWKSIFLVQSCNFMKYRTIIGRLFAILVIAGLVSGPGVKPSFAAEPAGMMAHGMMMDDGSGIAAPDEDMSAMPCCPSQTKNAPDSGNCDKCMMMSCSMTCFTEPVTAVSWKFALSRVSITALKNDRLLQGLGHSPPDQPPRI